MEKYINLIRSQIEKLSTKDFDLEAWKSSTTVLLERIFGEETHKISEINKIKYEHGSWALRDASGAKTNMDSNKKRGREILIAAINELENFGLPEKKEELININIIRAAIENELTVSQFKEIKKICNLEGNLDDKKIQFQKKLKSIGDDKLTSIFINLISDSKVSKIFN
ncbi:hypothetical protein ACFLQ5_01870 [Bacteroidota bacterium]